MKKTAAPAETRQYCTFKVAEHLFGIEVNRIQEVMREQELTVVPKAPPEIAGLLNLRGQILPAIDLHRRLGFGGNDGKRKVHVIFTSPDGPVDFLADEIGDVLSLDLASWEAAPESLEGNMVRIVTGIHKLQDKLLLVLDPAAVANLDH